MKNEKKIRILHLTDLLAYNSGVTSVLLNFLEGLSFDANIQCDIAVFREGDKALYKKVESFGGTVYELPPIELFNTHGFKTELSALFEAYSYDIFHLHAANAGFLSFPIADDAGVHHRIIHSHNSQGADSPIKAARNRFLNRNLTVLANHYFACSQEAGSFLFGDKIKSDELVLFPNAIDIHRFSFSEETRKRERELLHIEPSTQVIGHVGRMAEQKNQLFLLEAFAKYHEHCPDSILLLVGDGPLKEALEKKVTVLSLQNAVRFLGTISDPSYLYQAFDQFWLPSLFEGLPVSAIEAQTAGLPCLLSNAISSETNVADLCHQFSTESADSVENWVEAALSIGRNFSRADASHFVQTAGYDIHEQGKRLAEIYRSIANIQEV